jgi:hypothetical protein
LSAAGRIASSAVDALLVCALIGACTGQIGDGGPGGGDADAAVATGTGITSGSSSGLAGSGGSSSGSSSGASSGVAGGDDAGAAPFEALSVPAYVTKVKTMLTGLAPTQAEVDSVKADASALSGLVTTWMQLPQYTAKMELFFADAFQQSGAQAIGFVTQLDDGSISPFDELLQNFRVSFAKTVTQLIADGQPFTQSVTTTRYMMTTAMMQYYAYADSSMVGDATSAGAGGKHCRFYDDNPSWSWKLTSQPVSASDSGNPASPNYLVFSLPSLTSQYGGIGTGSLGGQDTSPSGNQCSTFDPVVFNASTSFALGGNLCGWLNSFILGGNFWWGPPGQSYICYGASKFLDRPSHGRLLIPSDYTDWRMVTITQAKSIAEQTRFFDLAGLRASSALSLFEQRVGYFTTPAFLSQYPTNISNQARVTIDQTMIVGLGQGFDGTDAITVANPPGLDPQHAANPACFQCHWNLDPMARYFRSNLTMNYSQQQDAAQIAVPGTFLFDGVVANGGTSLYYLASQIAAHPRFKTAWTLKLCGWANSGACLASDPEVARVAQVFASSNYSWNTLVHELFTSPLVTYAAPTLTTQTNGIIVPIVRRAQLCTTLSNRLGLNDVCGYADIPLQFGSGGGTSMLPSPPFCNCSNDPAATSNTPPAACNSGGCFKPGPIPPAAAELPVDGYSRGVPQPLYINGPDPFWRSSVEQVCAYVADRVVDAGASPLYSSSTPAAVTTSIADIVHGLMGLDSSRDAQPIALLTSHYSSATTGGSSPTVALKSTFTAACLSPWVTSVGQ